MIEQFAVIAGLLSAFSSGREAKAALDIAQSTLASEESIEQSVVEPTTSPDLNESIVDLKVAEYQAKSSAEVIKTADENLGTLLDVRV